MAARAAAGTGVVVGLMDEHGGRRPSGPTRSSSGDDEPGGLRATRLGARAFRATRPSAGTTGGFGLAEALALARPLRAPTRRSGGARRASRARREARDWLVAGVGADEVAGWREAGIGFAEAAAWHEFGYSLEEAKELKAKGNTPSERIPPAGAEMRDAAAAPERSRAARGFGRDRRGPAPARASSSSRQIEKQRTSL